MVLRHCHFFPGFSTLKLHMPVVAGFIVENILEKDKQGPLAKMGCRCCLCEVIFLQVTQADFHSLSHYHSLPSPLPLLILVFTAVLYIQFPFSFPTPALLKGSSPLIFLLPTTLYKYLILLYNI